MAEYASPESSTEPRMNTPDANASKDTLINVMKISDAIYLVCGYTDLRRSTDGLSVTLEAMGHFQEEGSLYLFCGRRADRLKALRRSNGRDGVLNIRERKRRYHWPRKGNSLVRVDFDTALAIVEGESVSFPQTESD